jgi:hypothetical protein
LDEIFSYPFNHDLFTIQVSKLLLKKQTQFTDSKFKSYFIFDEKIKVLIHDVIENGVHYFVFSNGLKLRAKRLIVRKY